MIKNIEKLRLYRNNNYFDKSIIEHEIQGFNDTIDQQIKNLSNGSLKEVINQIKKDIKEDV